jgi:UDP-N-acetylglucosamine transferase subunit ALG13
LIFVTVGGQLPFERLVRAVDAWAGSRGRDDVFVQTGGGSYRPEHARFEAVLAPTEFRARMNEARAVVAHAGMGTILSALEMGKPLLVLPRRAAFHETRNDHQVETARRFAAQGMLLAAFEESELATLLDRIEAQSAPERISKSAPPVLLDRIRRFALDGAGDRAAWRR